MNRDYGYFSICCRKFRVNEERQRRYARSMPLESFDRRNAEIIAEEIAFVKDALARLEACYGKTFRRVVECVLIDGLSLEGACSMIGISRSYAEKSFPKKGWERLYEGIRPRDVQEDS